MKALHEYKLRPMREEDLRLVRLWRNSERIRRHMITGHLITEVEHLQWFEKNHRIDSFNIFEKQSHPLGVVNITQINTQHRRAYWGFYLGEENLPKGTGSIMGYLALGLIFEELKIRKLCSEILTSNTASIKFHEKLGFQHEGVFRQHVFKDGALHDICLMAIMENNWVAQKEILKKNFF